VCLSPHGNQCNSNIISKTLVSSCTVDLPRRQCAEIYPTCFSFLPRLYVFNRNGVGFRLLSALLDKLSSCNVLLGQPYQTVFKFLRPEQSPVLSAIENGLLSELFQEPSWLLNAGFTD
jgi:hypothetical protein